MSSKESCEAFFDAVDADKSGSLSLVELKAVLSKKGYCSSDIDEAFKTFDLEGDGKVTRDEFLNYMGFVPADQHVKAEKIRFFNKYDEDHSGVVTAEELKQAMMDEDIEWTDDEVARVMEKANTDGIAGLTTDELFQAIYGEH